MGERGEAQHPIRSRVLVTLTKSPNFSLGTLPVSGVSSYSSMLLLLLLLLACHHRRRCYPRTSLDLFFVPVVPGQRLRIREATNGRVVFSQGMCGR